MFNQISFPRHSSTGLTTKPRQRFRVFSPLKLKHFIFSKSLDDRDYEVSSSKGNSMKFILVVLAALSLCTTGFAQVGNAPAMQMNAPSKGFASHGIRVSLIRPTSWAIQSKLFFAGQETQSPEVKVSDVYGAALGYAFLPANQFGFTTNAAFIEAKTEEDSIQLARLDANLAYSLGDSFSIKAGINLSHIAKSGASSDSINWTPSLAYQAGIGLQLTKNIGLDVMHTIMKQKGEYSFKQTASAPTSKAEIEVQESGLEVALHATF